MGLVADSGADIVFTGEAGDDEFGVSVSAAGDVNGDGFADVIVGAANNNAAGSDAGRVYVYYGGPSADGTPDLVLTGEAAGDFFGISVAAARTLFPDLLVGSPRNDEGGTDAGRAYVIANCVLEITSGDDLTATGPPGGPFSPAEANYTFGNSTVSAVGARVSTTAGWLLVNGGPELLATLQPSETLSVSVTIGPEADGLPEGLHQAQIQFETAPPSSCVLNRVLSRFRLKKLVAPLPTGSTSRSAS